MRPIDLNDLPKWSPWPARILGSTAWLPKTRSTEDTGREYNDEKYHRALDYYLKCGGEKTPEEVNAYEFGRDASEPMCVARGATLYLTTAAEGFREHYDMVRDTVVEALGGCQTVVELGCGYGLNLWRLKPHAPGRVLAGGDFADNAVRLAAGLYRDHPQLSVRHFDFYDEGAYRFLESLTPPLLIFTCGALELLTETSRVFHILARYAPAIETVLNFEPVYQLHDDGTLLEMMRRRYIELNDYNRDFLPELQARADVRISRVTPSVFAVNPLNPISIVQWNFIS